MVLRYNSLSNKYLEEFICMSFLIRFGYLMQKSVIGLTSTGMASRSPPSNVNTHSSIRHLRIQPDSFDKLVYLNKHQNSPKRLNVASVVGGHLVNQTKQIGLHVSWSEVKQPNVEIEDPDLSGSVSRYRLFASWTVGTISGNPTAVINPLHQLGVKPQSMPPPFLLLVR